MTKHLPTPQLPAPQLPALQLPTLLTRSAVIAATAAAAGVVGIVPGTAAAEPSGQVAAVSPAAEAAAAAPAAPVLAPAAASRSSAVEHALTKVGAPYRYGSEGPNAFDCSGLVSWAFEREGVSLPRTSQAMSQVGESVSRNELQRGDLVFFYEPVSHVGIYLGNGKIVHASNESDPVKVSGMGGMEYNSARRV